MSDEEIISLASTDLAADQGVLTLFAQIRPAWQTRNLITRVRRLLGVDPSSACQRLLNAAVHDLREKVTIAGLDIAKAAADHHKLPPIISDEDLEDYPVAKLLQLAYRMGLLTRPEWRRLCRCYEIRRDLEHEDDEYEAGIEDCVYIFKTCIEVVLQKDPVHLLRVEDIKTLVEEDTPASPSDTLLADYERAPDARQEEICKFLLSVALDSSQSDIVQQNAYHALSLVSDRTRNRVKLNLVGEFQRRVDRFGRLNRRHVRVAAASGVLPYLRQSQVADFFQLELNRMRRIGWRWRAYDKHGELLRNFKEVGGLGHCPSLHRRAILKWLVQTYIGEPGGVTSYGNVRHVFYSNTAAPQIEGIFRSAKETIRADLERLREDMEIVRSCRNTHVARRFEALLDFVEPDSS